LNSNPNFKNYSKSEFGHKSKVVELEIMKIPYLGNFSSCYMFLKVILEKTVWVQKLGRGECYSSLTYEGRAASGVTPWVL
jgi:hypothetical protein